MPQVNLTPLPMKEALAFWRDKVPMTRDDFDELVSQQQARAFYVSGLHKMDQIDRVYNSLYKSLAEGTTFAKWKKEIMDIIDQEGWSGVRLAMIFRTNVQSAYAAGRYAQMQNVKKSRPYWMYDAIDDSRTRPAHRAMDGRVFPADSKVWETWYPPNGFRCRCGVIAVSKEEAERDGLKVETEDPTGKPFEPIDPRTGGKLPARPLVPDNGFSGNIGKDWFSGITPTELDEKIKDLSVPAICRDGQSVFADENCKPPLAGIDARHILKAEKKDILFPGKRPETYVRAFLSEFGLKDIDQTKMYELPGGIKVPIGKGFFIDKKTGLFKSDKSGRGPYVRLLARTIINPYEIWHVPAEKSGRPVSVLRLIRLFAAGGKKIGGFVVWNLVSGRNWQAATAFTPKVTSESEKNMMNYLDNQRKGVLIYREE